WHRSDGGDYYADAGPHGRVWVRQREQDKRRGVLRWFATVQKVEVAQGEVKGDVQGAAEKYVRNPKPPSAAEDCIRIVPKGDVDVVERDPSCSPKGVDISSPKKLHAAMKDLVARQGHEVFWCVGKSKQGELVGQPVQVAVGQVDRVVIDVADFVGVAAKLRQASAVSIVAVHCHPSGHGDRPSEADRDLTRRLRKAMEAINVPFDGHYVFAENSWSRA
ncbi:MAG: JAB domain-containing protein, partial [Patescibacteria group bacterium]|nr:JAB domain-containing protein [Patescibacteria group bacterium]